MTSETNRQLVQLLRELSRSPHSYAIPWTEVQNLMGVAAKVIEELLGDVDGERNKVIKLVDVRKIKRSALLESFLPDDPEPGCGYGALKTKDDPFSRECDVHDARYAQHEIGEEYEPYTRARADKEFFNNMFRRAGNNWLLKARAWLYYGIVRTAGGLVW